MMYVKHDQRAHCISEERKEKDEGELQTTKSTIKYNKRYSSRQ